MSTFARRAFLQAGLASAGIALGSQWLDADATPLLSPDFPIPHYGGRVLHVRQGARGPGDGSPGNPYPTIQQAAEVAHPGDTVLVHEGVYRERVLPRRGGKADAPITYMSAPGETVQIKGSELLRGDWRKVSNSVYRIALPAHIFRHTAIRAQKWVDWNPFTEHLTGVADGLNDKLTLGQVAVNGTLLSQAPDDVTLGRTPGSWMATDSGNGLLVHFAEGVPPSDGVEITVRDRVFAPHERALGYIHVRGFWMEHCANQFPDTWYWVDRASGGGGHQQAGMLGTRTGHHWVIEYNVVQNAGTLGIDCGLEQLGGPAPIEGGSIDNTSGQWDMEGAGRPGRSTSYTEEWMGYHLIRHNVIRHNGAHAVMGPASNSTEISYNVIEDNNRTGFLMENYEIAAIKMHFFYKGIIEGNLIRRNDTWGIWLDNFWRDARISRNVILNNKYAGIFMELDYGPATIDNNIIAHNRGDGIYSHDTSKMTIAHNWIHANNGIQSETFHGDFGRGVEIRGGGRTVDVPDWIDPDYWKHLDDPSHKVVVEGHKVVNNIVTGQRSNTVTIESKADNTIDHNQIDGLGRVEWDHSDPLIDVFSGSDLRSKILPADAAIPKIASDFYNQPIHSGSLFPGPFQIVQDGYNRYLLSPGE